MPEPSGPCLRADAAARPLAVALALAALLLPRALFAQPAAANGAAFIQGHLGVAQAISAGEKMVTIDSNPNLSLREKRAGKPTEIVFSEIDPTPVWAQTAATFDAPPHPNAARLFLSWWLRKEQQAKLDTWSARVDVPPPEGLPPLLSLQLANRYPKFLADAAAIAELRKRFEAITGPVRASGGVR